MKSVQFSMLQKLNKVEYQINVFLDFEENYQVLKR